MNVELFAFHFKQVELCLNVIAVVAEGAELPCEVIVVCDDHAAFAAGREVFALAEAEAADIADGSGFFALVDAAEALCAVFDNLEVVLLGDLHDRIHVGDDTVEVDNDNRFCAFCDEGLNRLGVNRVVRRNVREYGEGACLKRAEAGGDETVGGADDFVAGPMFIPARAVWRAHVPLATLIAFFTPSHFAHSFSNCIPILPVQ